MSAVRGHPARHRFSELGPAGMPANRTQDACALMCFYFACSTKSFVRGSTGEFSN